MERAAKLEVQVAVAAFPSNEIAPGTALLFPIIKMLFKMTGYPEVVIEEMAAYGNHDALGD